MDINNTAMNINCSSHTSSPASNPSDKSGGSFPGSDFERVMSGEGGGGGRRLDPPEKVVHLQKVGGGEGDGQRVDGQQVAGD